MNTVMKQVGNMLVKSLKFLDNEYVMTSVRLFLVLYAGLVAPRLPEAFSSLFDNAVFRVFVLFLIAYLGSKDATLSMLVAVGFVVSMIFLRKAEVSQSLAELVNAVVESPQHVVNDMIDGTQKMVRDTVDKIQDVVPMMGSGDVVGDMVDKVQDATDDVINKGQELVNNVVDMGKDAASGVVGRLSQLVDTAASF